jgi:hypothetical protein
MVSPETERFKPDELQHQVRIPGKNHPINLSVKYKLNRHSHRWMEAAVSCGFVLKIILALGALS